MAVALPTRRTLTRPLLATLITMAAVILLTTASIGLWKALHDHLIPDEGVFSETARIIVQDHGLPYRDTWDHKPPLIYYLLAPFVGIFGATTLAIKIAAVVVAIAFSLVATGLVYQFTTSRFSAMAGGLVALVYGAIIAHKYGAEPTFLMATLEASAVLLAAAGRGRSLWMLAAGLLFAGSFFAKQPALLDLPVVVLVSTWKAPTRKLWAAATVAAGFCIGVGLVILWAVGNGIAKEFWYQAFSSNFSYIGVTGSSAHWHFDQESRTLFERYFLGETVPFLLPLLVLALLSVWTLIRTRCCHTQLRVTLVWGATSLVGASVGRAWTADYFLQMLPPLIVLATLAVPNYGRMKPQWQMGLVITATALLTFTGQRFLSVPNIAPPSEKTEAILNVVKQYTQPGDCLWTWGHLGMINYLSGRRSCTRQLQEGPLMVVSAFNTMRNRNQYMAELIASQPALHIRNSDWWYFPELETYAHRYLGDDVLSMSGLEVYRVDRAIWHPVEANFSDQIALVGVDLYQETLHPGDQFRVSLTWRVLSPIDREYGLFIHLLSEDESASLAGYDGLPAGDRPTETWMNVGEIILSDTFTLDIPKDIPPGRYHLVTGFYDFETTTNLEVMGQAGQPQGNYQVLAVLEVTDGN